MQIFRVPPGLELQFSQRAEIAMGIQLIRINVGYGWQVSVLMSDSVIIYLADKDRTRAGLRDIWFDPLTASENIGRDWASWYESLDVKEAEPVSADENALAELLS